jgi:hypothetical protein
VAAVAIWVPRGVPGPATASASCGDLARHDYAAERFGSRTLTLPIEGIVFRLSSRGFALGNREPSAGVNIP